MTAWSKTLNGTVCVVPIKTMLGDAFAQKWLFIC